MNIGVILLLSIVALIAIMVGSCFYFSWVMRKSMLDKLRDLDDIRTNQQPPLRWQKRYLKHCQRSGGITAAAFERQKRKNLRKLKHLTRFASTTNMVEDESVRDGVLQELSLIRQQWLAEELSDAV